MVFHPPKTKMGWAIRLLFAILILAVLWPMWLAISTTLGARTLAYEITPAEVVITFGFKKTRIDRSEITAVELIEQPSKGRRLFGTNVPGLKEGRWSFEETGRITLFATSVTPLLVIETESGKWGISPQDPQAFLEAMETGMTGEFQPVPGGGSGPFIALLLIVLLTAGIVVVLIFYVFRVSRNIAYELGDDALLVHGSWRPVQIPYAKITGIRIANPEGVPWRIFGIGMPGLHWGSYSWKQVGPNLYLYATRLRPLVLISAGTRTYGVTPEDAERFVAELKKRVESDGR